MYCMKILFISPDIEEKPRGINFILKHLLDSASSNGDEVGILIGLPATNVFSESKILQDKILHLHLQHYLKEGRGSFRYFIKGGYRKRNLLKSIIAGQIFKPLHFKIKQEYLSSEQSIAHKLSYVVQSPYVYQFLTRNIPLIPKIQIRRLVKKFNIDLVVVASPSIIGKKDVKGAKLVHFIHDSMPFELLETPPDNNTPTRYAEQFYNAVTESDLILANSEDTKSKVLEIKKNAQVNVLYGAASNSNDKTKETSILETLNLKPQEYHIFISTIEKRKNISTLLDSYALGGDRITKKLVLVGGAGYGIEEIYEKYNSLTSYVQEKIIFTGYVSEGDKYTLLSNSYSFIFPSLYEGFGLPIIEAQQNGVPVITSKKGALKEAAGDAALFIDEPRDANEILSKICTIESDSNLRTNLIDRGTRNARKFTINKFQERLERALNNLRQ